MVIYDRYRKTETYLDSQQQRDSHSEQPSRTGSEEGDAIEYDDPSARWQRAVSQDYPEGHPAACLIHVRQIVDCIP